MNEKKIAFIACVNNEREFSEALYYINRLSVPEGYEIDTIAVNEAPSMTAGYNAAMQSSDAKYKVYIHQDTFIIHTNFIEDMLKVFRSDEQIGILGCIGCKELPLDAQAVVSWDAGKIYHNCTPRKLTCEQSEDGSPVFVEAVDGLLLATQYDVAWREDIFDGWDFYDISQCFEMRRAGYKVAVPYQESPWCYHDNSYSKMGKYQDFCARFAGEYQDFKPFYANKASANRMEYDMLREQSREELARLVDAGEKKELEKIFINPQNQGHLHLREFELFAHISRLERQANEERFWMDGECCAYLREKLAQIKFYLKRIEFEADAEDATLSEMLSQYSIFAIDVVNQYYCVEKERVWLVVSEAFRKKCNRS